MATPKTCLFILCLLAFLGVSPALASPLNMPTTSQNLVTRSLGELDPYLGWKDAPSLVERDGEQDPQRDLEQGLVETPTPTPTKSYAEQGATALVLGGTLVIGGGAAGNTLIGGINSLGWGMIAIPVFTIVTILNTFLYFFFFIWFLVAFFSSIPQSVEPGSGPRALFRQLFSQLGETLDVMRTRIIRTSRSITQTVRTITSADRNNFDIVMETLEQRPTNNDGSASGHEAPASENGVRTSEQRRPASGQLNMQDLMHRLIDVMDDNRSLRQTLKDMENNQETQQQVQQEMQQALKKLHDKHDEIKETLTAASFKGLPLESQEIIRNQFPEQVPDKLHRRAQTEPKDTWSKDKTHEGRTRKGNPVLLADNHCDYGNDPKCQPRRVWLHSKPLPGNRKRDTTTDFIYSIHMTPQDYDYEDGLLQRRGVPVDSTTMTRTCNDAEEVEDIVRDKDGTQMFGGYTWMFQDIKTLVDMTSNPLQEVLSWFLRTFTSAEGSKHRNFHKSGMSCANLGTSTSSVPGVVGYWWQSSDPNSGLGDVVKFLYRCAKDFVQPCS